MTGTVEVIDRTGLVYAQAPLIALVGAALEAERRSGSVALALVDESEMADLNGRFRGVEGPTDVLSFRYGDGLDDWPAVPAPGEDALAAHIDEPLEVDLGEIVVCPAVVERYAREEGVGAGGQLAWALVHGVLHLLGYDHEIDDGGMRQREQELLGELQPLVRAVSGTSVTDGSR